MKIFCLRPYRIGYTGCVEDVDDYAYFQFQRKGMFRKLLTFPKNEFKGYAHFVGGMSKFMPGLFFFTKPVAFKPITIEELDRIHQEMKQS